MENDLIERYIYAVTKRMPAKLRSDISSELETLIADMLEERCKSITPTEKDIRVVLTELGTPYELAEKYNNSENKSLIGPAYFSTYKTVLKIVIPCAGFGIIVANILDQITEPSNPWFMAIFQTVGSILGGLVFAFAIVTMIFAFFEHKGDDIRIPSSLDDLPPVPKINSRISKWEPIAGIIFSVIFFVVFLLAPQILGANINGSRFITVFNVEMIRNTWYIVLAFAVLGVAKDCVKLIDGRYTHRVMIANVVANTASGVLLVIWFNSGKIINPDFTTAMANLIGGETPIVGNLFLNFQTFLMGIVIFALVIDSATTVFKTFRSKQ